MLEEIKDYKVSCDFCSKKRKFSRCRQVVLRIDKQNNYQFLFGMMCSVCEKNNIKKTIHGQTIKVITSRNRHRDEISVFDDDHSEIDKL